MPVFQTVVALEGPLDTGLWTIKHPSCSEITPESRWAQVDGRVWADTDVLLPKRWPSFYHGIPLHSLLTAVGCDTVSICGCTTLGCVGATTVDSFSNGLRTLVPEGCVGDQGRDAHISNLRDMHRRYAEAATADEAISYLEGLPGQAAAST